MRDFGCARVQGGGGDREDTETRGLGEEGNNQLFTPYSLLLTPYSFPNPQHDKFCTLDGSSPVTQINISKQIGDRYKL